jgi:hypothetical protein
MAPAHLFKSALAHSDLERLYRDVRDTSEALGKPLSDADATVQSMPDASPAKWHLAHTTWFFEATVLSPQKGLRALRRQVHLPLQFLRRDARGAATATPARHDHPAGA